LTLIERLARNQNYQFWAFQVIFWLFWSSFYLYFNFVPLIILADALVALFLTTGLRYIYQALWERRVLIRVAAILGGSAIAGLFWNIFKRHMELQAFGSENLESFKKLGQLGYYTSQYVALSFWVFLGWSGLYEGLAGYAQVQKERATSLSAKAMAHEAQLRMLRYQLNPHFLFNTLNAISTLILDSNNKIANEMVSKLSHFLRYSLDKDPLQRVDLDHEISTLKLYLEIEQVRFEDRLKVEFKIENDAGKALIPSMLLQPLIENSIKYVVASREEGGKIEISAKVFAGDLHIKVQDDGPGITMENGKLPEFTGVGIGNLLGRLEELYGPDHSCRISGALPHGLEIEIRIPFETLSADSDSPQNDSP